jgi:hypothetical protein
MKGEYITEAESNSLLENCSSRRPTEILKRTGHVIVQKSIGENFEYTVRSKPLVWVTQGRTAAVPASGGRSRPGDVRVCPTAGVIQ